MFLDVFRVLSRIYCLQEKSLSSQKAMSFLGGLEGIPSQIPQIEPWFWNRFFFLLCALGTPCACCILMNTDDLALNNCHSHEMKN